ncbi:MAG: tetratricopeptide repeat protein [Rhodopirellula sp.]|nr:tetratricopeptide repeat protein [Rhodopirellula sp.]
MSGNMRHRTTIIVPVPIIRTATALLTCHLLCGCVTPFRSETARPETGQQVSTSSPVASQKPAAFSVDDSSRNQERIATAASLMHAGNLVASQELLVEILAITPSDCSAVELLAKVSRTLGDYQLQRTSLKRLITLQAGSAVVLNRSGKLLLDSVQMEASQLSVQANDEVLSPVNSVASFKVDSDTDAITSDEATSLAIAAMTNAVELSPRNTLFAQDLFAALIGLGRNEEAEQVLQEALRQNPRDRILPMTAARLYESREDWSGAIFYYDVALRNDPTNPVWRRHRAVCHFRQGSYEKARSDFSKSLAGSPVKPQLSEHLAWAEAAIKTDDHAEAGRVLNLIVTRGKFRTADLEVLRGTCLLKQGNVAAAAEITIQAQLEWPRHEGLWRLAKQIKAAENGTPVSDLDGVLDLASLTLKPVI